MTISDEKKYLFSNCQNILCYVKIDFGTKHAGFNRFTMNYIIAVKSQINAVELKQKQNKTL